MTVILPSARRFASTARRGFNESDAPIPWYGVAIVNDGLHLAGNGDAAERLGDGHPMNVRFDATLGLAFVYRTAW
jgi:hypothetical protein